MDRQAEMPGMLLGDLRVVRGGALWIKSPVGRQHGGSIDAKDR